MCEHVLLFLSFSWYKYLKLKTGAFRPKNGFGKIISVWFNGLLKSPCRDTSGLLTNHETVDRDRILILYLNLIASSSLWEAGLKVKVWKSNYVWIKNPNYLALILVEMWFGGFEMKWNRELRRERYFLSCHKFGIKKKFWTHKELNRRMRLPMLHHWAIETPTWTRLLRSFLCDASCILLGSSMSKASCV